MTKLFKMYGELFMEVTPQPWLLKASKTVKTRIAEGKRFCVNLATGALTVYDPENIREEAVETKPKVVPHFQIVLQNKLAFALSPNIEVAMDQLKNLNDVYGLQHCVISSNQEVTPVGYPAHADYGSFLYKVKFLYSASHAQAQRK